MAPSGSGKSSRGRGAKTGSSRQRDSVGNHISSSSSTPTATNSGNSINLTRLPPRYNFIPHEPNFQAPPHQASSPQQPTQRPLQPPVNREPIQDPPFQPPQNEEPVEEAPNHQPPQNISLEALLTFPGRDKLYPRLSPNPEEGMWFTREETPLVNRVVKILKDLFDGPFYSWSVTPNAQRDRCFTQFAHYYTWDPILTPKVRDHFEDICQRRLKDTVSFVRTKKKRERPRWIPGDVWTLMEENWKTEDAIKKSKRGSTNRMSQRGNLGIAKHVGGPKSFARHERDMVEELQRPVSAGEVFMRTHTRKDGTYVDGKAKLIGETYEKNLQARLAEIVEDPTQASDGASGTTQLTPDEMDEIFMKSTIEDHRGNAYGLGRLAQKFKKRNEEWTGSSTITDLQQQLRAAERKLEEQDAENKRRDEELLLREAESRKYKKDLEFVTAFLKNTDPRYTAWLKSQESLPEASSGHYATPPERHDNTTPSSSNQ